MPTYIKKDIHLASVEGMAEDVKIRIARAVP